MEQRKMIIKDGSSDKKYFTIIPNYIANHSTANDQALYFQMKRLAGDEGLCYATISYFCKKLRIGKKAYKKSLKYLLDHKWIAYAGKENIMTAGGQQFVDAYRINDIWKMNNDYYSKGGAESDTPLGDKGGAESIKGGYQKDQRGGLKGYPKKNSKKNYNKNASFNKPYYKPTGEKMWKDEWGKWWVIKGRDDFSEFAGKLKDITWK